MTDIDSALLALFRQLGGEARQQVMVCCRKPAEKNRQREETVREEQS